MKTVVTLALGLLAAAFLFAILSAVFGAIGFTITILTYVGGFALAVALIFGLIGCLIQEVLAVVRKARNS